MANDPAPPSSHQDPANLPSDKDELFRDRAPGPSEFRFDEAVARVFPDMLRRSIPGYSALLHMMGVLAGEVMSEAGVAYDLGCSLGAVSLAIRHGIGARQAKIIAIDNSEAMVTRCRDLMSADSGLCPVEVRQGDITELRLEPCNLVVLNFTLQFAPPNDRQKVLSEIAKALVPGGVLVLSEKTQGASGEEEDFYRSTHDAFRRSNGYSQLEMSRKREALERVLVPQTVESYKTMLRSAGLQPVEWFRCLHFVSWVGKKPQ